MYDTLLVGCRGGGAGWHDFDVHRRAEHSACMATKRPGRIPTRRMRNVAVNVALKLSKTHKHGTKLVNRRPVVGNHIQTREYFVKRVGNLHQCSQKDPSGRVGTEKQWTEYEIWQYDVELFEKCKPQIK